MMMTSMMMLQRKFQCDLNEDWQRASKWDSALYMKLIFVVWQSTLINNSIMYTYICSVSLCKSWWKEIQFSLSRTFLPSAFLFLLHLSKRENNLLCPCTLNLVVLALHSLRQFVLLSFVAVFANSVYLCWTCMWESKRALYSPSCCPASCVCEFSFPLCQGKVNCSQCTYTEEKSMVAFYSATVIESVKKSSL